MALNWQGSPNTWSGGDFTADGIVSASDLNELALSWQESIAVAAAAGAVDSEIVVITVNNTLDHEAQDQYTLVIAVLSYSSVIWVGPAAMLFAIIWIVAALVLWSLLLLRFFLFFRLWFLGFFFFFRA